MSLWVFIDFLIFLYVGNFHNKILRKNQVTIIEVVEIICCLFNRNFKCKTSIDWSNSASQYTPSMHFTDKAENPRDKAPAAAFVCILFL